MRLVLNPVMPSSLSRGETVAIGQAGPNIVAEIINNRMRDRSGNTLGTLRKITFRTKPA
ncbi:MAG: hypothetical protein J0H10_05540 [Alphaproteobacteria bacterium]|jgi:hypothetical protein|nr:hypothetical protein [Alphaproteobacteria bacterium]